MAGDGVLPTLPRVKEDPQQAARSLVQAGSSPPPGKYEDEALGMSKDDVRVE